MAPNLIPPLSQARRTFFMRVLFIVFFLAVPILFLYATGYRFSGFSELVKTGGIYVSVERSGTEIYINDELVRETGTFRRAFFMQDLEPGTYLVEVRKEDYHPWQKVLPVRAHFVTEAEAFNIPTKPELTPVLPTVVVDDAIATSTEPNPLYSEVVAAFAATTSPTGVDVSQPPAAATPRAATTTKEFRGVLLAESSDSVVARWTRSVEDIPFYFCRPERPCADEVALLSGGEVPSYFDFFPGTGDLVVVTLADGIYVTELDDRSKQNTQPLFLLPGADVRVLDGAIYVQTPGGEYFEVEV